MIHRGKKSRAVLLALIGAAVVAQGARMQQAHRSLAQAVDAPAAVGTV